MSWIKLDPHLFTAKHVYKYGQKDMWYSNLNQPCYREGISAGLATTHGLSHCFNDIKAAEVQISK